VDTIQEIATWLSTVHPGVGIIGLNAFARSPNTLKPSLVRIPLSDEPDASEWEKAAWEIVKLDHASRQAKDLSVRVRLASYLPVRSWKRSAVRCCRTWMVDVDAHAAATPPDVLAAQLLQHVEQAGLPPPTYIMATGWGLHGLWCATQSLPPTEWSAVAHGLRGALRATGLVWDQEATTDITRSTRPPHVVNWRVPAEPRVVKVLHSGAQVVHAQMPRSDRVQQVVRAHGLAGTIAEGIEKPAVTHQPWSMETVVKGCAILDAVHRGHGRDCSEPQWRACLQIAAFATDSAHWAHQLSSGHPLYTETETDRKLGIIKQSIADGTTPGPLTCEKMRELFHEDAGLCSTCKFFNVVKSPAGIPFASARIGSKRIRNAREGEEPGLYFLSEVSHTSDDTGATRVSYEWRKLADWEISEVQLIEPGPEDPTPGQSFVQWRAKSPRAQSRLARVDVNSLHDPKTVVTAIAKAGLGKIYQPSAFLTALQEIRDHLRAELRAPIVNRLGWETYKGKPSFGFGTTLYAADEIFRGIVGPAEATDEHLFTAYTPVGRLSRWQEIMRLVCQDRRSTTHAALGMACGAALVHFTRMGGLQVALVSPNTGVGKSTILRIAQSIWGPRSMMGTTNDTINAVTRRLSLFGNLPFIRDEFQVTGDTLESLQQIFSIESGAEKARMTAGNSVRFGGSWNTLVMLASNDSLSTMLRMSRFGRAGMARVLELTVPPVSQAGVIIEPELVSMLEENHGRAAESLIQRMVKMHDRWPDLIIETRNALASSLGLDRFDDTRSQMRFLLTTAAVGMLGGRLAVTTGTLPDWNAKLALGGLLDALSQTRDELRRQDRSMSVEHLLAQFVRDNASLIATRTGPNPTDVLSHAARHSIPVGEYDTRNKVLILMLRAVELWSRKNRMPLYRTTAGLDAYLSPTMRSIAIGTGYSIPASEVLVVPASVIGYDG